MDQLVVLNHAGRVKPADRQHRLAPEARERAGDEQQRVHLVPGVARQEVADIFVSLEEFEEAARNGFAADGRQHPGRRDERFVDHESVSHRPAGAGVQQRIAVDREDKLGVRREQGGVEGAGLASVWQAQPAQGGMRGARAARRAECGRRKPVIAGEHGGGVRRVSRHRR